eukprot:TRINITY_DN3336_c0_g1_i1.p2 TRINITY_DN3336_c0_g1~~TRINITY_DN3336_c0_g1_i1.p2  ORF type:complete len:433 (+),score=46.41 TRINITY_DN3336_c0_g1_i1:160-1299(+)
MQEICDACNHYEDRRLVMRALWKRVTTSNSKEWPHVYKALAILEYLLLHGPESLEDEIRDQMGTLKALHDFQALDEKGQDKGVAIREKSKKLVGWLAQDRALIEERNKTAALQSKFVGFSSVGGSTAASSAGMGSASPPPAPRRPILRRAPAPRPHPATLQQARPVLGSRPSKAAPSGAATTPTPWRSARRWTSTRRRRTSSGPTPPSTMPRHLPLWRPSQSPKPPRRLPPPAPPRGPRPPTSSTPSAQPRRPPPRSPRPAWTISSPPPPLHRSTPSRPLCRPPPPPRPLRPPRRPPVMTSSPRHPRPPVTSSAARTPSGNPTPSARRPPRPAGRRRRQCSRTQRSTSSVASTTSGARLPRGPPPDGPGRRRPRGPPSR